MTGNVLHVGIIMDGNGRWAKARGLPRVAGHRKGADAVRRTLEAAPDLGIGMLTLYAFSSDNWKRPAEEVSAIMRLFSEFLQNQIAECVENGVRLSVIGRRDRLPQRIVDLIESAEAATAECNRVHMRLAVDYSSRDALLEAARRCAEEGRWSREALSGALGPDVDLLIRTGGEQRLSDFMLWENAYAELVFTPRMWPEFSRVDLEAAMRAFESRERRFGSVPAA